MQPKRSSQAGYNLVEVIVAMGLLASVLLSIVTLFFMGRSNVYSGKQMTRAVAVGTNVTEDLVSMNVARLINAFELAEDPAENIVAGVTYTDSIVRVTSDLTNDAEGYLERWEALIPDPTVDKPHTPFLNAEITLVFLPRQLTDVDDLTTTQVMQIKVVVEWDESVRRRNVVFETVKLNRNVA
ncbi:MAG TPA: type II secretion system protein [Thermoanaerobaculia bacterium]|nr:type II secretion system protein [Thermoanaerobaculia bacterium]